MIARHTYLIDGRGYWWYGWYGCQLCSREWFKPDPYKPRVILGRNFYPYSVKRRGLRYDICWTLARNAVDFTKLTALIDDFRDSLHQHR